MNIVCRDIFRAIYEGKWLSIEYKNQNEEVTRYWVAVLDINLRDQSLKVDGLHLAKYSVTRLKIFIASILSSHVIEGSFYSENIRLKEDIRLNPHKYAAVFQNVANLKILNYLSECNKLDNTPYKTEYFLITHLDGDSISKGYYYLNQEQFQQIVSNFQYQTQKNPMNYKIKQLAMNVLSIHTKKGLYVLAYRSLMLDVSKKCLRPSRDVTICSEFSINGLKQSIRKFLDADDYTLLDDFEANQELIKDKLTKQNPQINGVDDMPYLIAIGRDMILDLHSEYAGIEKMYEQNTQTVPIRAFFGDLVAASKNKKNYPITLLDRKINLDQLLAIHNAMKYPLTYIQGPPGTGKTNTIVNAIITAFFNERTVLFTSYNNHPIEGVFKKLTSIEYASKGKVPFPVIRLGNDEVVAEAMDYMKVLYETTREIKVYEGTLERNKDDKILRTGKLTELLKEHEEKLDLLERKEAIEKLMASNHHLTFQTELQGEQLYQVNKRLNEIGEIRDEDAIALVMEDEEEFRKYLYYTSAKYIKRLSEPKNEELLRILYLEDRENRIEEFNRYIKKEENVKKFIRIFPIVATTSISAHKIGEAKPYFDMTIMDEASQGNNAVSLVPIIRGKNLMMVGDPQQLSPVIVLDPKINEKLRKIYHVSDEYDYIKNSIYKTFLASDSVSEEILLSRHYRCHEKIIGFNNKKYYNNKLVIRTGCDEKRPLVFCDVPENKSYYKNTAPEEAYEIVRYAQLHEDKNIGVITPFANQKEYINELLKEKNLTNVSCGTVHAYQGDEKDVILFSLALTDKTSAGTYHWLKNNKELINVATSRARNQLIILASEKELKRLHDHESDDLYELVEYVKTNGVSQVTSKAPQSRALGIRPYSTETETAFLENLNHALDNVLNTRRKCVVKKEVSIAQVFNNNTKYNDLFYMGRFDFVVYERDHLKNELPILAIELDGKEHYENDVVMERDRKKNEICKNHGFELIRIENTYARRYNYIKEILIRYFNGVKGY